MKVKSIYAIILGCAVGTIIDILFIMFIISRIY